MSMRVLNRASKMLLTAVLLGAPSAWAQGENYDIYLFAGQSNADGRGEISEIPGLTGPDNVGDVSGRSLASYAGQQPDHRIYFSNPGISDDPADNPEYVSGWQTLEPGYSIEPGFRGALTNAQGNLNTDTFGPEVSFASTIREATGTTNNVGIIKVTDGGTSLAADWRAPGSNNDEDAGGLHYALLVNQATAALEALAAEGNTGTIRGLVWHQGESDTGRTSRLNAYQERFENFVAQLQADLGLEVLPTVIGELAPDREVDDFTVVQEAIDEQNELISLTSSDNLVTTDGTHFDTFSQLQLGERFAQDLAQLVVIPEPATAAVLCLPLVALASRRRRG